MTALAELAGAARRLRRLQTEIPWARRPSDRAVFGALDAARAEVVELVTQDRDAEAAAVVADWEREAASTVRMARRRLTAEAI